MKKLLISLSLSGPPATTTMAPHNYEADGPKMNVEESTYNFGKIPQGIPAKHKFGITNTGNEPLIIQNVQKTCGCTVTDWTKDPIMPGESGYVTAQYNAARMGNFKKPITVVSNATNSPMRLYFKGEVVKKSELKGAPSNENSMK
jgi:hypothetical protein